ncbi:MAG: tRNA (N(6)-L-threonylcarbamoyladenosine(37)-C(2))-methylthiotransferase MtaB, partial [Acidobacteria bacterium]|nr:tRNA (N(6)-L-threonylcarbamoyladenosine(37)-C(2))-methylthiotransferase MtaB [Acidobacteriota bacterium]
MNRPTLYHVATLGCKLNQFDSAVMEADLAALGMSPTADPAAARVVVINTCTVTSAADAQSRQLIRKLRRANPHCTLLVTGCYAQRDPKALEAIAGVDAVLGLSGQKGLKQLVVKLVPETPEQPACLESADDPLPLFSDQTRAFLKIQEGCDLRCSYCVIPSVRGASRSVDPETVLRKVALLAESGFQEIVFTGVNTGDYGKDLTPATTLAALLRSASEITSVGRLRLNSVEPRCVTEELVETLQSSPRLAPHLQIPLQSGSDEVLGRMRRPYRTGLYRQALETLRGKIPEVGLGADVIVGFPGETQEEFRQSYEFIASSQLNYLHVFSFTPRPGTPAADAADPVRGDVIRKRSAELRALGGHLSHRFRTSFLGRDLEVLGLRECLPDGRVRALSGNFIE